MCNMAVQPFKLQYCTGISEQTVNTEILSGVKQYLSGAFNGLLIVYTLL